MLTIFNNWLDDNARATGILGLGVRYTDKTIYSVLPAGNISRENLESSCQTVAEVFQTFKLRKTPVPRLTWKFEKGILHSSMRSDGHCLCLVAAKELPADEVERILYEFQTLW